MFKEFKEFALKGNALDLAVGVIIGAAFSGVVSSLVDDIIMPPIGLLLGKVDFKNLFLDLSRGGFVTVAAAQEAGVPTLNYGMFLQKAWDFAIVAGVVFFVVRAFNRLRKSEPEAAPKPKPTTRDCPYCLSSIPLAATRCAHCTAAVQAVTT